MPKRSPEAQRLYDAYFKAVGNPDGRDVFEVMVEYAQEG